VRQVDCCTADRLLHCGISAPSGDGFMAEMGPVGLNDGLITFESNGRFRLRS